MTSKEKLIEFLKSANIEYEEDYSVDGEVCVIADAVVYIFNTSKEEFLFSDYE